MSFGSKLLGSKRNDLAAREVLIKALIELQVEMSQVVYPSSSKVTLRKPELLASIARAAIHYSIPHNTAEKKSADIASFMDVLVGAVDAESILNKGRLPKGNSRGFPLIAGSCM